MKKKDEEQVGAESGNDLNELAFQQEEMLEKHASEQSSIQAACQAYGIPEEYVLMASCDLEKKVVTILTHGGKRVRWSGESVRPLTEIEVTGINPGLERRKPIAGKRRD